MATNNTVSIQERARRRKKRRMQRMIVKTILYLITLLLILLVVLLIAWGVTSIKNKSKGEDNTPQTSVDSGTNTTEEILPPPDQTTGGEGSTDIDSTGTGDSSNQTTGQAGAITHDDPSVYAQFMNKGHTVNVTSGSYGSYSREMIPFGFGSKVDEKNRPTGVDYYTNLYGKYGADYIMPESKYIWLTMDNGYEAGTTEDILDTLKAKNVPCVFFLTKPYCEEEPELVKRMIADGHVIGNHTTTHPAGGIQAYSVDKMYADIKECSDYIQNNFGYTPYLFRFPEGASSEQALAVVQSLNMRPVFWSFAYKDWVLNAQPDVKESLNNALNKVHGGEILLLHAESRTNADMLADFIDGVRAKGFEFAYYSKVD